MLNKAMLKDRLGDVAVAVVLGLVFVLTACGGDADGDRLISGTGSERPPAVPAAVVTEPAPGPLPEAVTARPGPVSFEEAETAFRERRYGEAVELFAAYTEDQPQNAWGHYLLGLAAWKSAEHGRAEDAFERALELDPAHVKSLLNLSRVYLETDRPEEALEEINRALDLDATADGFRLLGRARHVLGDVEGAIDSYKRAIVLDDTDVWSMNNLGYVFITQERFEEALPPLARATELRSDVPVFQNNLGIALERTGYFAAATAAYQAALSADSGYVKAATNLARVEGLGDSTAVTLFDRVAAVGRFVHEVEEWRRRFDPPVTPPTGDPLDPSGSAEVPR